MASPGPHPAATARTSDEARAGRSAGERAALEDPEAARQAWAAVLAGPAPERERLARQGFASSYAAWSRGDWELNTLFISSENYVFKSADLRETLPDALSEYRGVEGYLEAQTLLAEGLSMMRLELADVVLADPDRIVTLARWTGEGARSGAPFEQLSLNENVFDDGLNVEQTYWWDAKRGAESLGLELPRR